MDAHDEAAGGIVRLVAQKPTEDLKITVKLTLQEVEGWGQKEVVHKLKSLVVKASKPFIAHNGRTSLRAESVRNVALSLLNAHIDASRTSQPLYVLAESEGVGDCLLLFHLAALTYVYEDLFTVAKESWLPRLLTYLRYHRVIPGLSDALKISGADVTESCHAEHAPPWQMIWMVSACIHHYFRHQRNSQHGGVRPITQGELESFIVRWEKDTGRKGSPCTHCGDTCVSGSSHLCFESANVRLAFVPSFAAYLARRKYKLDKETVGRDRSVLSILRCIRLQILLLQVEREENFDHILVWMRHAADKFKPLTSGYLKRNYCLLYTSPSPRD